LEFPQFADIRFSKNKDTIRINDAAVDSFPHVHRKYSAVSVFSFSMHFPTQPAIFVTNSFHMIPEADYSKFFLHLAMGMTVASFLFILIGLWRPWVMLWWEDTQNRLKVLKLYGSALLIFLGIYLLLRYGVI
jgi:hypothetical protein